MTLQHDPSIFLTAEWRNLVMLNYVVEPGLLENFVPRGTELDFYEGKTYISLVGFEFNRTRVLGFSVPFHQNFEEVNVRFYVRRGERKGVVFIKELVPRRAIAAVARWAFNENYQRVPMGHRIDLRTDGDVARAEFSFLAKAGHTGRERCAMAVETEGASFLPDEGSESQFITEHYWGYAAQADGGAKEYEVRHPRWKVWRAKTASFTGDTTSLYGAEMAQILNREPDSAFLAEGSAVTVFKGTAISR